MNTLETRIASHEFFRDLRPEHLQILLECARDESFAPGDVIFRQGEPADRLFLIEHGAVALENHDYPHREFVVQELTDGDVMGWSWLFSPFVWHFQARATAPTTVIAFEAGHLLVQCERDHDFGYEVMKRVSHLLIARLQSTRRELMAFQDKDEHVTA